MGYKVFTDGDRLHGDDINLLMGQSIPVFADATERDATLTAPVAGQLCYVRGIGQQHYVVPSGWRTGIPETAGAPPAPTPSTYTRFGYVPGTGQILQSQWTRVRLETVVINSGAWTASYVPATTGGTVLTCVTAGRYIIQTTLKTASGAGMRGLSIADNVNWGNNCAAATVWYVPTSEYFASSLYGERTFAVGDTLAVWAYSAAGSFFPNTDCPPYLNVRSIP